MLALYPSGIPIRDPPSCEAPREPTIYPDLTIKTQKSDKSDGQSESTRRFFENDEKWF